MSSDKFAQWWLWDSVKPNKWIRSASQHIRLFALIMNCTITMKTKSRFSRNVYAISDRVWRKSYLRHTTADKYDKNGKDWYFQFDDDNKMSYIHMIFLVWAEIYPIHTSIWLRSSAGFHDRSAYPLFLGRYSCVVNMYAKQGSFFM